MSSSPLNPIHDGFDWYGADYEISTGRSRSLVDSAAILGVSSGYLRKILMAEGIHTARKTKGKPIYLSEETLSALKRKIDDSINLSTLHTLLGIGPVSTRQLVEYGVIPAWVAGGKQGPVHRYRFLRTAVEQWAASLTKTHETVPKVPEGHITIADAIRSKHLPVKAVVDAIATGQLEVTAVLTGPGCFGNFIIAQSGIAVARPPELSEALSAGAVKRQGAARSKKYVYVDTGRRKRGGPPRPPASTIIEHLEHVDRLRAAGKQVREATAEAGLTMATYYVWRREFGRRA